MGDRWQLRTQSLVSPAVEQDIAWKLRKGHWDAPPNADQVWSQVLGKIKIWKAPGPDCLGRHWLKVFERATCLLKQELEEALGGLGFKPDWMVKGHTVLIPKEWSAPSHISI